MESLCISGMHRSGTSLTTSWLEQCGLITFNKMQGGIGNEKGHFEDNSFVKLNEAAIKRKVAGSKGWIVRSSEVDIVFNAAEKELANKLLQQRLASNRTWGWKDPRTTLLLYSWKEHLPELKVLLLWRPCQLVVDSLVRRSLKVSKDDVKRINLFQAIGSWIAYNKLVVKFILDHPKDCILVNINNLLGSDKFFFDEINLRFNLELNFIPISNLLSEGDFSSKVQLKYTQLASLVSYFEIRKIEEQLMELSLRK